MQFGKPHYCTIFNAGLDHGASWHTAQGATTADASRFRKRPRLWPGPVCFVYWDSCLAQAAEALPGLDEAAWLSCPGQVPNQTAIPGPSLGAMAKPRHLQQSYLYVNFFISHSFRLYICRRARKQLWSATKEGIE
jgi:hypothetical protein